VTWQADGENLEEKLTNLHDRVHKGGNRTGPARRTYIPKADGPSGRLPFCVWRASGCDSPGSDLRGGLFLGLLWVPAGAADDTIVGFEHEHEATAFLHDLPAGARPKIKERMPALGFEAVG